MRVFRVTLPYESNEIIYMIDSTRESALARIHQYGIEHSKNTNDATCAKMDRQGDKIRKHKNRHFG